MGRLPVWRRRTRLGCSVFLEGAHPACLFLRGWLQREGSGWSAVNSHISRLENVVRYGAPQSVDGPGLQIYSL